MVGNSPFAQAADREAAFSFAAKQIDKNGDFSTESPEFLLTLFFICYNGTKMNACSRAIFWGLS
ncbi:hypothetical protein [Brevibacillus agri]|uniref:Uncharacterized protein n=1 Tax=Brevibacillus agri TaxID=51101 RepID=A0A3M8ARM3_9BACL|nr:hypothetical protein [Brevibacillus agri]ELK43718.1 hypothetical protein D478_01812 [Brevibacillus agri BAB-2500]MBG9568860.1 hypothetical protein [Brevibacillus agri]MED3498105.1 hypothetical protein [Brevibacillus agri]QAV14438.1 hypothetical protein BA6348_17645 [Brevibacillus agri]RNB53205.1 hypothetical protein EB820_16575 [Brevibacillus agri]